MKTPQRQVVADITPTSVPGHTLPPAFNNYFAQVSGGEITAPVEKVYDGGSKFPETLCAPPEIGDITITRHYDPDRDGSAIRRARQLVGQAYYDVTVYTLDCDMRVFGTERVYPQALLIGLSEPEGDSSSGTPAVFSMTFSISTVSGQTSASI